jgi:hypothetical protein
MVRRTKFTIGVASAFKVLFVVVAAGLAVSAGPSPQWVTHKEGFYSVELPPGWTVSADMQKGWVHITGTQAEHVVIWPWFLPGGAVPGLQAAQSIHLGLAQACPYRADWQTPQPAGPNVLRALGKVQNMTAVSVFTWIASPRGAAGYFYLVSAGETEFRQKQGDLAKILGSFRLAGAAGGAAGGGQFVSFRDPKEGAFTVEVPAGWKTIGGTIRFGFFEARHVIETESPDGQTRVIFNDPELPALFREDPNQAQGTRDVSGQTIYPFMTGANYCRYFIQARLPTFCSDLQISDAKDKPIVQGPPGPILREFTQSSTGSLSFSCHEQGQPRVGYCFAATKRTIFPPTYVSPLPQSPSSMWTVDVLLGYVAPPQEVQQAGTVMNHMLSSFAINPEWGMGRVQAAGAMSRIISGASQEIAGMTERSQRYRDAVDDRIAKLRSNATLGVTDVMDPATGRHTTVDSGSNYYWVDNRGMILGTDVDTNPSVDFRRLLELPPR